MTIEVTVIEAGSEAFKTLATYLAATGTHKVSIDVRRDGVAVKRNEGMWTNTLSITAPPKIDDWGCQQVGYHSPSTRHTKAECSMRGSD